MGMATAIVDDRNEGAKCLALYDCATAYLTSESGNY
jgi:hypothetical protein